RHGVIRNWYEARSRSDEQTERGSRVVHDAHTRPQLADGCSPLFRGQRGPRLAQVLALNLLSDDPVVTLGRARPKDPRVTDLGRKSSHKRDLSGHVGDEWRVRDPYREAAPDPGRVRHPESPAHPAELTAVLSDNLCRQRPDDSSLCRVAVLVERVRL